MTTEIAQRHIQDSRLRQAVTAPRGELFRSTVAAAIGASRISEFRFLQ